MNPYKTSTHSYSHRFMHPVRSDESCRSGMSHPWMNYGTHMNECCNTYEETAEGSRNWKRAISLPHVNESCHIYGDINFHQSCQILPLPPDVTERTSYPLLLCRHGKAFLSKNKTISKWPIQIEIWLNMMILGEGTCVLQRVAVCCSLSHTATHCHWI